MCIGIEAAEIHHPTDDLIEEFYSLDQIVSIPPPDHLPTDEDKRVHALLQSTTKLRGDRFETGLLGSSPAPQLPPAEVTYKQALRRLYCSETKC